MTSPHEQALAAAVREHDREDAAMRGEPDPWGEGQPEPAGDEWKDRIACMELAISAYLAALPAPDLAGWEKAAEGVTPGPWSWIIHDHSMASLGVPPDPGLGDPLVLCVSPCKSCQERADPQEWQWGRCHTPSAEDAAWIARSSPDNVLSALRSLSAKLAAVERERDTLTERLAEMEAGRPDDCETIVDRLRSLAIRREQEGIYTDAAIAERAAEIIEGVGAMSMSVDLSANDGQPDEQQEWHDYDPDC